MGMLQLILHGIGDYFLQTDWQALNKKKKGRQGLWACVKHCTTYSLPFKFIGSWWAVLAIWVGHFIIDRTNIVAYLIAWKNGVKKWVCKKHGGYDYMACPYKGERNCHPLSVLDISNFGFHPERSFAISIWLYIICDNLLHIIWNYFSLMYL